uniref:Uncharacterized protein n=1 Tax=Rhizophora mucronata TaxID=61149 RepID=A0A2P2NFY7_RHIMU
MGLESRVHLTVTASVAAIHRQIKLK